MARWELAWGNIVHIEICRNYKSCRKMIDYPKIKRDETVEETLHGVKVKDPYRWLENPYSDETKEFVAAQMEITDPFLKSSPIYGKVKGRLTELWNFPKYTVPTKHGSKYFFEKNSGLQNQNVIYVQNSLDTEPSIFLDPNTFSEDGTIALTNKAFSEDGQIFAYALSHAGSDWQQIKFKNVATGEDYQEVLEKVKFSSIAWTHDNKGIFYMCYKHQKGRTDGTETTSNENQNMYYHYLGTNQSEDHHALWWCTPPGLDPLSSLGGELNDSSDKSSEENVGCENQLLYYVDLEALVQRRGAPDYDWSLVASPHQMYAQLPIITIVNKLEADFEYITNMNAPCTYGNEEHSRGEKGNPAIGRQAEVAIFLTNKDAPRRRLIAIDLCRYTMNSDCESLCKSWSTIIPEHEKDVLEWCACVADDKLVTCYLRDARDVLQLRDLKTGNLIKEYDLDMGTISGFSGKKKYSEFFFSVTSFLYPLHLSGSAPSFQKPPIAFEQRVLLDSLKIPLFFLHQNTCLETLVFKTVIRVVHLDKLDATKFMTKQIFYSSKDGTKVPMFIVHKKDLKLDSSAPTLLYGYGGFNISMKPSFSVFRLAFIHDFNGVFALANIRGGGEYGEEWQNAGRLLNRQNCIDDFIAGAEYLIDAKYTSSNKLAIMGGSHGGMLVGACVNQRPELYAAAIPMVGVMDMLRFHKFTIGYAWCTDYGTPDEKEHFNSIIKYSPLHNIRRPSNGAQYPSILVLTADHDDRVVPLHSFKYTAELQNTIGSWEQQNNPLLIRIDVKAGHSAGMPTSKM
ncbi:hypothetical protein QYM36_017440, partial [Artemia franciscana]